MMSNRVAVLLVAGLSLVGCGNKKEVALDASAAGRPSPTSLLSSPKVPAAPVANALDPRLPKPDRSVPVSSYVDLNREPAGMALTYIVSAKSSTPMSDDDKLNRLSPAYYNETDAFKRKDLAKAEMPRVDAALAEYRSHDYYALPIAPFAKQPLGLTTVTVGQYDFNTKSFPLTSYGQECWSGTLRNQQGAVLKILQAEVPCRLVVSDEALAKQIESARSQNALGLQGTLYLFVPRTESEMALAVASRAHIDLINAQTKAPLGSFDL